MVVSTCARRERPAVVVGAVACNTPCPGQGSPPGTRNQHKRRCKRAACPWQRFVRRSRGLSTAAFPASVLQPLLPAAPSNAEAVTAGGVTVAAAHRAADAAQHTPRQPRASHLSCRTSLRLVNSSGPGAVHTSRLRAVLCYLGTAHGSPRTLQIRSCCLEREQDRRRWLLQP